MRRHSPLLRTATRAARTRCRGPARSNGWQRRAIQISSSASTGPKVDAFGAPVDGPVDNADARFEILGSTSPLLSVTLSPSQNLYTRRGTLVAVAGKAENVQSTLSLLSPFTRALLRIPFLYQRISSTTPTTLLISPTRSTSSSISLIHLDGTTDWLVASRTALLAWTGHGLAPTPRVHSYALGASHWGATLLSGRGLAALAAPAGDTYAVRLAPGEHLVAHPAHVVAYEVTRSRPLPFRLRGKGHAAKDGGGGLSLAVPYVGRLAKYLPAPPGRVTRFVAAMRDTDTYRLVTRFLHGLRTAARRSVYGDALFLRFDGPATLLLSGRAARLGDVLADRQVNELAVARPGEVTAAAEAAIDRVQQEEEEGGAGKGKVEVGKDVVSGMRVASVGKDGKVTLAETKDLNEFVR